MGRRSRYHRPCNVSVAREVQRKLGTLNYVGGRFCRRLQDREGHMGWYETGWKRMRACEERGRVLRGKHARVVTCPQEVLEAEFEQYHQDVEDADISYGLDRAYETVGNHSPID